MSEKKRIKVPYIDQTKDWPTGCESVSAVMLLQYLGIDISVKSFVGEYLEKRPFYEKEGKLFGPNPWKYFAGDPADDKSMGCYAPVIVKALESVFRETEQAWRPVDLTGVPMGELIKEYIDHDIPVIFWAGIDLKEMIPGPDWFLDDTGELFSWRSNEHCMLFVGYDENCYYFNDPWHNHGMIGYERSLVEKRHAEQYAMAVSVKRNSI